MKWNEVQENIKEAIEELGRALAEGKSDRFIEHLRAMARLPRYSFRNCLLIEQQLSQRGMPPATMVLGFRSWKKLGRYVKKGEKGLRIVTPIISRKSESMDMAIGEQDHCFAFRVAHVFDVCQTEGKDLPAMALPKGNPHPWLGRMEELAKSLDLTISYEPMKAGLCGKFRGSEIMISDSLDEVERLTTLIHEFAHYLMHTDRDPDNVLSKAVRELEAEAVAGIVGYALGLDCLKASAQYIQLYDGDAAQFTKRMDRIQHTATSIMRGIELFAVQQTDEHCDREIRPPATLATAA